jgi:hypothetical protein
LADDKDDETIRKRREKKKRINKQMRMEKRKRFVQSLDSNGNYHMFVIRLMYFLFL